MARLFPPRLGRTTVFRLALVYAGLYALITAIVLVTVYEFTAIHIHAQINADIQSEVEALAALYRNRSPAALQQTVALRSSLPAQQGRNPESGIRYYLLLDAKGTRLAGNLPAWPESARGDRTWVTYAIDARTAARAGLARPEDLGRDDPLNVRGLAVRFADGTRLLVVETLDEAEELSNYILISLLSAIGLILIAGVLGGIWMGRHVVARLEAVRSAAADIMAGDLSRRIPVTARRDEFSELAATLN
ncbi:MAG TPA: HAMP domain-containing protein, partial [Gammaproteobacteria bacterium]|nr:HAMP domain-containing protein [Gammaproteobacteria bacterium]